MVNHWELRNPSPVSPRTLITILALFPFLVSAAPWHHIDLLTTAPAAGKYTRVYGPAGNNGRFGVPVCGGVDVDGDGFRDYAFAQLIAAPFGRLNAGTVTLVFGNGGIGGTIDGGVVSSTLLRIAGDQEHEIAGAEIWMADITGDGLGELLIGRQNHTPAAGREGAGGLTVLIGAAALRDHAVTQTFLDLRNPPAGVQLVELLGARAYDRLGIWMRTGDVDGDGIDDVVVGANEYEDAGELPSMNSGAAYVIRGGSHWTNGLAILDLASFGTTNFPTAFTGHTALLLAPTNSSSAFLGATVQVGDLDVNGRSEVMLGATLNRAGAGLTLPITPPGHGFSSGGIGNGALFVVWDENFPRGPWPAGYQFRVNEPPVGDVTRIDGGVSDRNFGEEIISADFSGDGFPDLFVGDLTGVSINGPNSGLGFVFWNASQLRGMTFNVDSVPAGVATTRFEGPSVGAIGSDTVAVGDFDADGIWDLAMGNPHDTPQGRNSAGTVQILFGQPGGWPARIDLKHSELPADSDLRVSQIDAAKGVEPGSFPDTLCYSAAAGDIDGDGHTDLIANEMIGDGVAPNTIDVGNLLVISGASMTGVEVVGLAAAPSVLDFGVLSLGTTQQLSVTISNRSASAVIVSNVVIEGLADGYVLPTAIIDHSVPSGAQLTIEVQFSGGGPRFKGAGLRINSSVGLALRVALRATVFDPNSASVLRLVPGTAGRETRFMTQRGLTYKVENSASITNWQALAEGLIGTGGKVAVPTAEGVASREFYRASGR
jgi:hypothetical protein